MTFWQEVALVFTEIGWIPAICLILGMILIIVEIFQPGFGFFGIAGGILVVIGIIVRIYNSGGGNPIIQFFVLLAIVLGGAGFGCGDHDDRAKKGVACPHGAGQQGYRGFDGAHARHGQF